LTELINQEALDEVFPHPPIREVAFEIRFAPRLRVNAELWRIQEELVKDYPLVGMETVLQSNGSALAVNIFQNADAARAIKVSQENFVVAYTKYTRFEDFKEEVLHRTKQFCAKFDVSELARIGLRFVNNIVIPRAAKPSDRAKFIKTTLSFLQ
jgi:uncharacterized protein (TIGR04255 family)